MHKVAKNRFQGITLIEILLILGVLAIIASLAIPSVSIATSRADMRATGENLQYSIRIARNTARMTESAVSMNIEDFGQDGQSQRITFSVEGMGRRSSAQPGLQENSIPASIRLVSDYRSYEFDRRGMVQNPGVITLLSKEDKSFMVSFNVD